MRFFYIKKSFFEETHDVTEKYQEKRTSLNNFMHSHEPLKLSLKEATVIPMFLPLLKALMKILFSRLPLGQFKNHKKVSMLYRCTWLFDQKTSIFQFHHLHYSTRNLPTKEKVVASSFKRKKICYD